MTEDSQADVLRCDRLQFHGLSYSEDDESEYSYDERCRQKETYNGIQKAEEPAATDQHKGSCNGRQTPRMEVAEYEGQQTESEYTAYEMFFVIYSHHNTVRGTACRSRLRGHERGGPPRRKVFGENTAGSPRMIFPETALRPDLAAGKRPEATFAPGSGTMSRNRNPETPKKIVVQLI